LITILQLMALGIAVIMHEVAHGWIAEKCGDPTARIMGRITLNPLAHIDPIGSILLPLTLIFMGSPFLIGWARPVPVNFAALRSPKRDMIWVSIAGPGTNFILAIVASLLLKSGLVNYGSLLYLFLQRFAVINIVLAVFNLVPIPPLDGSRIVAGLLPDNLAFAYTRIEPLGFLLVIILYFSGILFRLIIPVIVVLIRLLGVNL